MQAATSVLAGRPAATVQRRAAGAKPRTVVRAAAEEVKTASSNGAPVKGSATALEFDELTELIKMVHSTDIVELELNSKRFKLSVKKKEALEAAEPQEGDRVTKGQVICIIEAMKLMNELEAEVSGTIVKILCENGDAVLPGQPLFIIKP
ncbi:hypothetical protein COHA_008889 [Chlorella ohadii]|uniref:Biotin carboxyl carrier protein of acetyl-CoA carboxylase n=1 Tax=Chlorella ohadii TaxID=2649997 RepID=A0AAD5H228_9CHLO|nr:hypothetical protein COHA_008889 [Chlorella ohadii]